jgi:hypothetical protein
MGKKIIMKSETVESSMRPMTKYKRIDDDHIEKTDELTGEKKIISVDVFIKKEFEQYIHDFHSGNYKKLIGDFNESQNKLSLLFCNYIQIIDQLISDYDEELFFLDSGCIYEDLTITTEEGETINISADITGLTTDENISKYKLEISRVLFDKFQDKKAKVDNVFLEITSKIDSGEKVDLSEMMKTLLETTNEINTKITKPEKPQWKLDAIKDGQLEKDGKTLRKTPEEMAYWLNQYGVEDVTTDFMYDNFRIRMARSTAQQAASRGKPEYLKKKK